MRKFTQKLGCKAKNNNAFIYYLLNFYDEKIEINDLLN